MNGVPVGRLFGFEIRIHLSWVLILALITVLVVAQVEQSAPDVSVPWRWAVGAVIAAAFLGSVLAHELGHAVVARSRGLRTGPITLYFFGGSASVEVETVRPRDEAAVAIAGPAVSLIVGGILAVAGALAQEVGSVEIRSAGVVAFILGVLNLVLGVVNLVPGFPLDGGRVVRAVWWARTGDERRGSLAAAGAGRFVGWGLVAVGLAVALLGDTLNGVMLGLTGWFLSNSARAAVRRVEVEDLLRGVTVGEVMERDVPTIAPQLTLDTFADQVVAGDGPSTIAVTHNDELLGVIGPSQVRRVGRGSWQSTRAEQLMIRIGDVPALTPHETVWTALDRLRRADLDGIPVVDASRLLGVVTRAIVIRTIQAQARLRGVTIR